ncbi:hypothetical protein [Corallococcus carmarthensis]|uniref:Uncharacterized protein n=1 Tax=Corallococcus carmarthensis TaxID=2316728 RepID=A0A3A8KCB5_9BACT|nr:hypothetical protein [Corallococcus carmarthensis]NOK17171.1 hypothetical protein [Corallococcus carmarthensis]RKH01975.1 hypothetical protein D7X32_18475 [Corallococcus carmarthensis]
MASIAVLGGALLFAGCLRGQGTRPPEWEGDRSIAFPPFYAQSAVQVGADTQAYVVDGSVLRAVQVAMEDFFPKRSKDTPCWGTPEAYRYRVIRQGEVFFILIHEDPGACGDAFISVDTGARYAVSLDGRILRRSVGAEPEAPPAVDAGVLEGAALDGGDP